MARRFRNTRRENRLEELGRVDAEKAYTSKGKRNLREEKSRIRKELKSGGPTGKYKGPKQPLPPDYWKDRFKDIGRRKFSRPKENLIEKLGGSEKAKPHSTKEGRVASGERRIRRILSKAGDKPRPSPGPQARAPRKPDNKSPGRPGGKGPKPDKRPKKNYMTPLKSGGSAKKPRPHGPHMWVRGDKRKKYASGGIIKILKKLGKEIKKQPLPKKTQDLNKKFKKAFPHHDSKGKLKSGGRVNKRNGGSAAEHYLQQGYGPHKSSGIVLGGKKVGIQIK